MIAGQSSSQSNLLEGEVNGKTELTTTGRCSKSAFRDSGCRGRACTRRREISEAAIGCSAPPRRKPSTQRSWQRTSRASPSRRLVSVNSWSWPMRGRLGTAGEAGLSPCSSFSQEWLRFRVRFAAGMSAPARLLVVDDEPRTAELTAELLRRAGYAVDVALSGTEALARVRSATPDLMLLDYEMPDMDAPEVLDELRSGADRLSFPVIILTGARPAPGDQVLSIERGAADYIAKGTDRQVLLARVRGALRDRTPSGRALVRGRLRVDLPRMRATLDGRELRLEGRPLVTLHILAERPGEVISRNELLERAWGTNYAGFEHSVEQAVHEVRRALGEPGWVDTVRGIGYRFVT